jgi:RNA-directed DNA polymerase
MSTNQPTRQQLYDRIRESSKDEVILEEMKRLGFWPRDGVLPSLPEQLIKRKGELQRELSTLLQQTTRLRDKEALLVEMRRKRMEEAKKNRELTKQKREIARLEKAAKWKQTKENEIVYLGEGVSAGLNAESPHADRLLSRPIANEKELSEAMGITLSDLSFLSYHRRVSLNTHYKRFGIPKKSGGMRIISAPMPKLKAAQYWILENVLNSFNSHEAVHGFAKDRSILTNANQHLKKDVVVNIDLKDFFPSVHFKRVKGLFYKLGYSEKIATILSLLTTEPNIDEVELDGKIYFVATGKRLLPQGAPTSPAITNLLCHKLDCRLQGVGRAMGLSYTRYADDITFSGNEQSASKVQQLLWRLKKIIAEEGFVIHPDKIHVMRKGDRQEVTGIVVNQQPGIDGRTLHRFRSLLYKIEKEGLAGKRWKGGNILDEITGYAAFVVMVKPEQGARFQEQINRILTRPELADEISYLQMRNAAKAQPVILPGKKSDVSVSSKEEKPWWNVL